MDQKTRKSRPAPLSIRFSDEERQRLEELAGGQPLSSYIRDCVLGRSAKSRKQRVRAPINNEIALAQALGLLGQSGIATSLSQLAHFAGSGSLIVDAETKQKIDEAHASVTSMRGHLIHALGLIERRSDDPQR